MAEQGIDDGSKNRAHIELFGPLSITLPATGVTISPTGLPAQIVAILATRRGAPLSAERLLDLLWPEAPSSGLNALQRHVSAFRRLLRGHGANDLAAEMVIYHSGAYRLNTSLVGTDLDLLDDSARPPTGPVRDGTDQPPRWWLEPLIGLPWEPFVEIRTTLDLAALSAGQQWLATDGQVAEPDVLVEAISGLAHRHPDDEVLWAALRTGLRRSTNEVDANVRAVSASTMSEFNYLGSDRSLQPLSSPAAKWLAGDTSGSLDALDDVADDLGRDTARRARRWFSTLDPGDGLPRVLLGDLVSVSQARDYGAERPLVSLDAYTLLRDPSGLTKARTEVADAANHEDLVRAQRVLVFTLMGSPLTEGLADAIEVLGRLGDPEADLEAARFSTTVAIRQGHFDDVIDLLEVVEAMMVERSYPARWYRDIARTVLYDHEPTRPLVGDFDPSGRFHESTINQSVVELSQLWHQLWRGEVRSTTSLAVRHLVNQVSIPAANALEVMHLLALGRPQEAGDRVRPFRSRLASCPRDIFFHLLPVAAARVAEALNDDHLATEVIETLEPWAGEYLGVWPFDVLIEPVDDLIARLDR